MFFRSHHCLETRNHRQKKLLEQYNFECQCEACLKDFPLFVSLSSQVSVPEITSEKDFNKLGEFDYKFAAEKYKKYCKFLEIYDKTYPCLQLCTVQECFKMCYNILVDNIPLKSKVV